ncbi:hypothetical protein QYF61_016716 [Mycteria americana]|uniref:Uncharacterized protein n=1 Tax=Mycteria americana TaxID=33587 RepID=A0AAN7N286_MYCAM|nr:hypothetical protein QYF61_016716 [Mycteria americana]
MQLFLPKCGTLHFLLLSIMRFLTDHFSSLSRFLGMAVQTSAVSTTAPCSMSSANLLRVHCLIIQIINEDVKQDWTHYWPPARLCTTDHHPVNGLAIQPVLSPPHCLLIQPILYQLLYKDLMGDSVKGLPEVQVDSIHCSSLIYQSFNNRILSIRSKKEINLITKIKHIDKFNPGILDVKASTVNILKWNESNLSSIIMQREFTWQPVGIHHESHFTRHRCGAASEVAATSKMDLLLPKAESISNAGGAPVITYLRKGKNHCTTAVREEKNMRKSPADPKVCEEGGGGGVPGTGAEVTLQPLEKTMVKQVVPLPPIEDDARVDIQPGQQCMEDLMPQEVQVP